MSAPVAGGERLLFPGDPSKSALGAGEKGFQSTTQKRRGSVLNFGNLERSLWLKALRR